MANALFFALPLDMGNYQAKSVNENMDIICQAELLINKFGKVPKYEPSSYVSFAVGATPSIGDTKPEYDL